jgi:hypothetical protein
MVEGVVEKVTYWADNSTDASVLLDAPLADGRTRLTVELHAPSGDIC